MNGHIGDAKHQLFIAESWRHGIESAAQFQNSKLLQAYRSLLDYIIWCDKRFTYSYPGKVIYFNTQAIYDLLMFITRALVWCHSAPCRSDLATTLRKSSLKRKINNNPPKYTLEISFLCLKSVVNLPSFYTRLSLHLWKQRHGQLLQTGLCEPEGYFEISRRLGSFHTELCWGRRSLAHSLI